MSLIKNLNYSIDQFSISIEEWAFADTGITALVGASGAGKTTIFKILCGLLSCPSLFWEFKGEHLHKLSPPDRKLGVCFQDLRLFPHITAKQNILFAGEARGYKKQSLQKDFDEIVGALQIEDKICLEVQRLSGGERQRVALARALISLPRLLLLDEPFTHLDEDSKTGARLLTKKVIESRGLAALLISHDQKDVASLARQVFTLKKGALQKNL